MGAVENSMTSAGTLLIMALSMDTTTPESFVHIVWASAVSVSTFLPSQFISQFIKFMWGECEKCIALVHEPNVPALHDTQVCLAAVLFGVYLRLWHEHEHSHPAGTENSHPHTTQQRRVLVESTNTKHVHMHYAVRTMITTTESAGKGLRP